jgi:hypothetical protein
MSSTTTVSRHGAAEHVAAVTAATLPFALSGIANHLLDHHIPAPETIEVRRGRVVIWAHMGHAAVWKRHADVGTVRHEQRGTGSAAHHLHVADLVLHGSCVVVELRWITFTDHQVCGGDDGTCGARLCACRDLDTVCPGHVEHACRHGHDLCPEHQGQCDECRRGLAA